MAKISIHTDTIRQFRESCHKDLAEPAGATYCQSTDRLLVSYLGQLCTVDRLGQITCEGLTLSRNEQTLILMYLINAKGLPPRHKWISFLELPEGEHHNAPFVVEGTKPLAEAFGQNLGQFQALCRQLGGQPTKLADSSFIVYPFPRLPVLLGIYEGDDEFEPKAIFLFDSIAPYYLTTAQLWVLGIEVIQRLTQQSRIDYL